MQQDSPSKGRLPLRPFHPGARLYASRELLSSSDVSGVGVALEPFCTVDNAPFLRDDMPTTDLLRYYVGFVGDVGPTEEDILWPNQVCSNCAGRQASAPRGTEGKRPPWPALQPPLPAMQPPAFRTPPLPLF